MTPLDALRAAVVATVLLGQVAAALAGVLPWPALPAALVLTVAGSSLSRSADDARGRLLRGVATALAGLLAVAVLPRAVVSGDPRELLGPLLVGISVVQSLVWRARRDLQGGLLSGLGLLVLGASYAPDVLVGLPLLAGWCTALAAGVLAGRARVAEDADLVLPGACRAGGVVTATALAAVLGLVAFLLVPVDRDAGLASRLSRAGGDAPGARAASIAGFTGRVDTSVRGELSDRPLLDVPADSPELWRGAVHDSWDGRSWTASDDRLFEVPGPPHVIDDVVPTRTDVVLLVGPSDGTVLSPGRPVAVDGLRDGARVAVTSDGAVRSEPTRGYRVSSVVPPVPAPVRPGTDVTDPRWLQLPASTPPRVLALARQLTAGRDRPSAVAAVEQWLRENATYRLDPPVPALGEDAVDRFLFVDRTGFCEQFAAAGTVLLRAAGVPARFVTGAAYGVPSGQGRRTFREKDLHAWVEVFHPGVGWVASDPTAGAERAAGVAAGLRARIAAPLAAALRRADTVPGGRPAIAAVLVLATAAAVPLVRRRRPRTVGVQATTAPAGPALTAFLRWDDALGDRRRRRAESVAELTQRVGPEPAVREALGVVERELYAAVPPAPGEVARAVEVLTPR